MRKTLLQRDFALCGNDDHMSGRQFLDIFAAKIESRLDSDAFRCENRHFVVNIIICGADACGITESERVAIADDATDDETAIPLRGSVFHRLKQIAVVFPQIMRKHGQQDFTVLMTMRMIAEGGQMIEHVRRVCQIEIARHQQCAGAAGVVADHWMTGRQCAIPVSAVAEMPEIDLSAERPRKSFRGCFLVGCFKHAGNPFQQVRQRHGGATLLQLVERFSGRHVQTDAGNARAVLTAVVLLLHQQRQLRKAVRRCAVFFGIVIQ